MAVIDKVIHVEWRGPFTIEEIKKMKNRHDKGVYQVYGSHIVYGSDVLLYIGQTGKQTFAKRLSQEYWNYNQDAGNVRYYVGHLSGTQEPREENWLRQIDLVEAMLIHSHWPAGNSQNIQGLGQQSDNAKNTIILNWGYRRSLLSEVSGLTITDRFNEIRNYHCYGDTGNTLGV